MCFLCKSFERDVWQGGRTTMERLWVGRSLSPGYNQQDVLLHPSLLSASPQTPKMNTSRRCDHCLSGFPFPHGRNFPRHSMDTAARSKVSRGVTCSDSVNRVSMDLEALHHPVAPSRGEHIQQSRQVNLLCRWLRHTGLLLIAALWVGYAKYDADCVRDTCGKILKSEELV